MIKKMFFLPRQLSTIQLITLTTLFWTLCVNRTFFANLLKDYPLAEGHFFFLCSVTIGFISLMIIVLSMLCHRYTTKSVLIFFLFCSAFVAHFMDSYNIIVNVDAVRNTWNTDSREVTDLFSPHLLLYAFLFGALPSWYVARVQIIIRPFWKEYSRRIALMLGVLALSLSLFLAQSAAFSSFFREHGALRYYANPANYIYAVSKFTIRTLFPKDTSVKQIGLDARLLEEDRTRELLIIVVGETTRADHFSLNGYKRKTNPLLAKEKVVSFSNVTSCGTSTNISLPCMFSNIGEAQFDNDKAAHIENVLDVLEHAKVHVLWRDNNSSSKGVADRVPYEDWREPSVNKICDPECRDVGMLDGLQTYIDSKKEGDIVIVLHQMGNHGPAYYKRYPEAFEIFKPVCKTNELAECSIEEITNAYDNALLYTDYFLKETISLLKNNDNMFETAMFYIGDHGESLGENGMYLHGMPNFIAPKEQRHVPFIIWLGDCFHAANLETLAQKKNAPITHDVVFHTILGALEIQTSLYRPELDLIHTQYGK